MKVSNSERVIIKQGGANNENSDIRTRTPQRNEIASQNSSRQVSPFDKNRGRRTSTTPTRQESPFDNKFYNRVYVKDEKEKFREQMRLTEIQALSETKKMSQNSYRILCKQLEERLAYEIQSLDLEEAKQLSFEGLVESTDVFYSEDSRVVLKRDEEMEFHEQLWMILSNFQDSVSADFTFTILRLLLDPAHLKVEYMESLFTHYITQQFSDFLARREEAIVKYQAEQQSGITSSSSYLPWSIRQFVQKFRALTITNIGKIPLNNIKEKTKLELSASQQSFPFSPNINDRSRILDDLNKSRLLPHIDNLLFESESEKSQVSRAPDRVELMNQKHEIHQQKVKEMQEKEKEKELIGCTFRPKTNNSSPHSRSLNNESDFSEQLVYERLYARKNGGKQELEAHRRDAEAKRSEEALKECTFQPVLTPYSPSRSKSPNGFEKNIGRMRLGFQKHVDQQQKLNYKPVGEGLERRQKEKFNPPEMLNRSAIKHQPFIVLDISISAGRSGRIGVCEGDNPVTLAKNFSKAFQLDEETEETVLEVIESQINSYNQAKAKEQRGKAVVHRNQQRKPSTSPLRTLQSSTVLVTQQNRGPQMNEQNRQNSSAQFLMNHANSVRSLRPEEQHNYAEVEDDTQSHLSYASY